MTTKDIRPLGTGDGLAYYWIKVEAGVPRAVGHCELVAIDDVGEVTTTGIRADYDPAAMTRADAVQAHLAGAIAQADSDLERRRREAPEPKPKPPPMDPATRRFLSDD